MKWLREERRSSHGGKAYSSLRQPRLAHPINMMIEVLVVLVDKNTFLAFDCETGIDPQHLRGFGSRLLNLSRLVIRTRHRHMRPLRPALSRYAFATPMHLVPIAP